MPDDSPTPIVPAEVDLRDFAFMPLDVRRLLTSETWMLGSGDSRAAAMCLWLESWHQVPAGSLPDNDRILSHLSQSGPAWKKARVHALRGWVKCTDGRLYHPVVAEKAMEAWGHKQARVARTDAARAERQRQRELQQQSQALSQTSVTEPVTESKGQGQGQGQGQGTYKNKATRAFAPPEWVPEKPWVSYVEMRRKIRKAMTDDGMRFAVRELDRLRGEGQDPTAVLEQSIFNSWQGLFAVRVNGSRPGSNRQESLEERNRRATEGWRPPDMRGDDAKH